MSSMRSGFVPHMCVFCKEHRELTYDEYRIGVSTAAGENYLLSFPESLQHYLDPKGRHDWKLNYHPPEWFINDIMDPDTTFTFPPEKKHEEIRGVGYLTSLKKMSEEYGDMLLTGAKEAIEKKQFPLDDIVDTHGTDGNVNNGTLAVFKLEPLPEIFNERLNELMLTAFSCHQFEKYLSTCCQVEFDLPKKITKPVYYLSHDEKDWVLKYMTSSSQENINIDAVPELRQLLEQQSGDSRISFLDAFSIREVIKKYHCLTKGANMLPQNLNRDTFHIELRMDPPKASAESAADFDNNPELSSIADMTQASPDGSESSSSSVSPSFFKVLSPTVTTTPSVEQSPKNLSPSSRRKNSE